MVLYGDPDLKTGFQRPLNPIEPLNDYRLVATGPARMACLSGAVCGRLLRSLRASVDLAFSDEVHWDCAEAPGGRHVEVSEMGTALIMDGLPSCKLT